MRFEKLVRKFLHRRGYEITKIDRFRRLLDNEYRSVEDFCFVQIGANDGISFDDLFPFVASRKCRGLVVEPLTYYYNKLKLTYAGFEDIKAVKKAIHKSKTEAVIHYSDPENAQDLPDWAEGIGSFDPKHHEGVSIPANVMISEKVECTTLMELIDESGFARINLLQIDAEGYDGEIVKMIDFKKIRPAIIKFENKSLTNEDRQDVLKLLSANGYSWFEQAYDTVAFIK